VYTLRGSRTSVPEGFSFTTLMFGFIPSLMRQHWSFVILSICGDLVGLWLSGWVFGGGDALLSVVVIRVLLACHRNGELATSLKRDGWTSDRPSRPVFMDPSNDDHNPDY